MKYLLIVLITLIPVVTEIIFDHYRWNKGLDDKPISTYLRAILFVVLAYVLTIVFPQENFWRSMITGGLYLFFTHWFFFDGGLNISRGKALLYHKKGELLWQKPQMELFFKPIFLYSAWAAFFHWDWVVSGETPTKLYQYFMF